MTNIVPADQIEQIVGARRHPSQHLGRAVSAEETVYILHSAECKASGIDLRDCEFSVALDRGIDTEVWHFEQDQAVPLAVTEDGWLVPTLADAVDIEPVVLPPASTDGSDR